LNKVKTFTILTLAAAFWGFQPSCIKWLVAVWSPVTLTACRYFIMSLIILAWAYARVGREFWPRRELWPMLFIMACVGILINNVSQFTGLKYTTVTNCTIISATSPVIAAFMSYLVIREKLSRLSWLGMAISFVGVLLVVSHGSLEVLQHLSFNRGDMLCFVSQVSWTIYSLLGLKVMEKLDPIATTGWAGFLGAWVTLAYGLATDDFHPVVLEWQPLVALLYTITCGGVFAMISWNLGVKAAGVSLASIFLNIMPVVGMLAGYFLFQEEIGLAQLGGALAIFCGVFLTTNADRVAYWVTGSSNSYARHAR
jgi:drug/metabolite transporter (DMT)-like permease